MDWKEARNMRAFERVRSKLDACLASGDYYEAHQLYRSLYFRYLTQKKYKELQELVLRGADIFLSNNQQSSGADLAILYVTSLVKANEPPVEDKFKILDNFFKRMTPGLPERETFLRDSLEWSASGSADHKGGHPGLHRLFALTLWAEKNYTMARHHFIYSSDGQGCAALLVEIQRTDGYSCEVDLFIAQAVLQYLCMHKKNTATIAFNAYTKQHPQIRTGPPYLLPLLNFIWFLLKAIESGKLPVFTVLCEKYEPSIRRDPSYSQYLNKIAQIFFGVPSTAPRAPGGLFGNFFNTFGSLFDDTSDSEDSRPGVASSSASATSRPFPNMETEDVD